MRPRLNRRSSGTVAALAATAVALLAPLDASAARGFKLGVPQLGDMSVARVVMRITPTRGATPGRAVMRVRNARRLPRNVGVAGRLRRIGKSNRYIARVFVLHSDPSRISARAAQPIASGVDFLIGYSHSRVDIIDNGAADENVITDPDVPPHCFLPQSDDEWSRFTPLVQPRAVFPRDLDPLSQAARDFLCARPVPRFIRTEFGTLEPVPEFDGVHRPFEGSRVEHVFRLHGNTDVGGFRIDPPPGGEFVACAGAPCLIDSGRVFGIGPIPAGEEVEVNARATVDIPRSVEGAVYPGDSTGVFGGVPRNYRLNLGFRF